MLRRAFVAAGGALLAATAFAVPRAGAEPIKIGLILPMTGPFASTGRQIEAAASSTCAARRHGRRSQGRADRQGRYRRAPTTPSASRRNWSSTKGRRAGRLRPDAAGARHRADCDRGQDADGRDGGGGVDHHRAVALHRAHQLHVPQVAVPHGRWAAKNGIKQVVTLVSDYGPGIDAEKTFVETLHQGRRPGRESARAACQSGLRALPAEGRATPKPDALFVFVPPRRARSS